MGSLGRGPRARAPPDVKYKHIHTHTHTHCRASGPWLHVFVTQLLFVFIFCVFSEFIHVQNTRFDSNTILSCSGNMYGNPPSRKPIHGVHSKLALNHPRGPYAYRGFGAPLRSQLANFQYPRCRNVKQWVMAHLAGLGIGGQSFHR
jgi:hypothetical protein